MNLRNFFLSLNFLLISNLVYSKNLELKCSKDVTRSIQKHEGAKLFNELIKKEHNLPCLIRFSQDYSVSDYKEWYVVTAMTKLAGKSVVAHLDSLRLDDKNSWLIRTAVAKSLGVISSLESLNVLHKMLNDRSLLVRTVVVDILSKNKTATETSYPILVKALDDKNNFYRGKSTLIRKHIIDALYLLGGEKAKPILSLKIKDSDDEVAKRSKKYLELLKVGSGEGT